MRRSGVGLQVVLEREKLSGVDGEMVEGGGMLTVGKGCPWCGQETRDVLWVGCADNGGVTWGVNFDHNIDPDLCDIC
jgi:hypothetical protein